MSAPIKNSSVSSSKKVDVHKDTPAITPDSGMLVIALIVIAIIGFVLSWQFGLFKKIKNFVKKKKSEMDESLADTDEE